MIRLDDRTIDDQPGDVRAFLVVRNEIDRLPFTLAHHRKLGVSRFFVVDNASTDGTREFLLAQPDVHVFATDESYHAARLGIDWLETLLNEFGVNRWCVLIDADEWLVYPDYETTPLKAFCESLERVGLNCLATMFIDLYAEGPIRDAKMSRDEDPLARFCYFDGHPYHQFARTGGLMPRIYGGVRARLFWPEVDLDDMTNRLHTAGLQGVNEAEYLRAHPDVRRAVEAGVFESGLEHFLVFGWREGRAVVIHPVKDWPESAYLSAHADVRDAIARGDVSSGLEHFVRFGQFESRLLSNWPPCLSQVPLIRWEPGFALRVGRHSIRGANWRRWEFIGGALLHFRLTADTATRAHAAIGSPDVHELAISWRDENARYAARLAQEPELSAMDSRSLKYRGVDSVFELGRLRRFSEL